MIDFNVYKDKVKGCWWGKYAGGVMGMPFEGVRGVLELDGYVQKDFTGIDNDDIDLQLVWLRACEKYGNKVDSHLLAEYWLTYISADISEYGTAKANLRAQIPPPICGKYGNINKNSNGAYIRSEIWACLCAGNPDIAVRYAMEDAMIDHADEGVYGEVFMAAMQSEAFVESSLRKVIEKGLFYIPRDCGIAKAVYCALECYDSGKDWKAARKQILKIVPSGFVHGHTYKGQEPDKDIPFGPVGYDAPANVGLTVMALLYGEMDLKRTMCIAAGCMEDADCTCSSAGATVGILVGYNRFPSEMIDPLDPKISTGCIRYDGDLCKPKTIDELVERVLRLTPVFLGANIVDTLSKEEGYTIREHIQGFPLLTFPTVDHEQHPKFDVLLSRVKNNGVTYKNPLFTVTVYYEEDCMISKGTPKKIRLRFWNHIWLPQWLSIKLHAPKGLSCANGSSKSLFLEHRCGGDLSNPDFNCAECEFVLELDEEENADYSCFVEISSRERYNRVFVPVTLLKK